MMSNEAAEYHALFESNKTLAEDLEVNYSAHRGWSCVVRFYAALHLLNAYLIDKRNISFDPESTEHRERTRALSQCPELREVPHRYRNLKNLSESVRYDVHYAFTEEDVMNSIVWLNKIVAIIEPKLKKK
jgi:hypothetical protein